MRIEVKAGSGLRVRSVAAADRLFQEQLNPGVPFQPFPAVRLALFGKFLVGVLPCLALAAQGGHTQAKSALQIAFRVRHSLLCAAVILVLPLNGLFPLLLGLFPLLLGLFPLLLGRGSVLIPFLTHDIQVCDDLAKLVLDRPENLLVILDDGAYIVHGFNLPCAKPPDKSGGYSAGSCAIHS